MHSPLHYKGGVDRKQRIVTHIVLVLLLIVERVLSEPLFLLPVQALFFRFLFGGGGGGVATSTCSVASSV